MRIIWRLVINAIAVWVTAWLLSGIKFEGGFFDLLIVAAIFGIVNAVIRPVVRLLTLPINIATLGLFTFIINAVMLMITAGLSGALDIEGGVGTQILNALLGSLVISIISVILSWVLPDEKE